MAPFSLLDLPKELLDMILHNLALLESFILSQTCKLLQEACARDWKSEIDRLSAWDREIFKDDLAHVLPGYWKCFICSTRHPTNRSDTPPTPAHPCPWVSQHGGCHLSARGPRLQLNHVQLALKYARIMPTAKDDQKYFNDLLAPLSHDCSKGESFRKSHSARFKISAGRFLAQETWTITPTDLSTAKPPGRITRADLCHPDFSIVLCSHMRTGPSGLGCLLPNDVAPDIDLRLESAIETAIVAGPDGAITVTCRECPTECEVRVQGSDHGSQRLVFHTWKDFGREAPRTSMDGASLECLAHLDPSFGAWPDHEDAALGIPGAGIRRFWNSDGGW